MIMFELNFPELKILTERQLDRIHNATLEILEKTGVVFKHPKALQVFHEAGAQVDFDKELVRIPTHLVEEALRKAGVAQQNLVQVSSILPPKCKVVSKDNGLKELVPGSISFCVMFDGHLYPKQNYKWKVIYEDQCRISRQEV